VRVVLSGKRDRVRGDARVNLDILTAMGIEIEVPERVVDALGEGDLIIDALLGTGLDRPVEGPLADVIDGVNRARDRGARVLSADLPSGLDADSGEVLGCAVDADLTVCFGAWKPGLLARAGQVVVGGIGAPRELIERLGRPIDAGQA
jgi:NAD(P)H-hydrate epimerase